MKASSINREYFRKKYSLESAWKNIKKGAWKNIKKGVDRVWDKVYIIPTASEADKFLKQKQNFWNI